MRKKKPALIMALVMILGCSFALAACGGKQTPFDKPANIAYDASTKTITFDKVAGASTYSYAVTAAGKAAAALEAADLTDCEISVSTLSAGDYAVKIRANAAGKNTASDWAEKDFTVTEAALAPLHMPTGLLYGGGVITWNTVSGASEGYTVKVFKTAAPAEIVVNNKTSPAATYPSYTLDEGEAAALSVGGYTIEVYANAVAGQSAQSPVATTTFDYKYPSLAVPQNIVRTGFDTIEWDAVAGAESYTVTVKLQGAEIEGAGSGEVIGETFRLTFGLLNANENYRIEVRANAVDGLFSASSAGILNVFSTPAKQDAPQGFYPELNGQDGALLIWEKVDAASAGYTVEVYTSSGTLIKSYPVDASDLSQLISYADAAAGTVCYAYVYANEVNTGDNSEWRLRSDASAKVNFTQPPRTLGTPSASFNTTSKRLAWASVEDAEDYTVKLFKQGKSGVYKEINDIEDLYLDVSALGLGGGTYTAEVYACADGWIESSKGMAGFVWSRWNFEDADDFNFFSAGASYGSPSDQPATLGPDGTRLEVKKGSHGYGHLFRFAYPMQAGTQITLNITLGSSNPHVYGMKEDGLNGGGLDNDLVNGINTLTVTEDTFGVWFMASNGASLSAGTVLLYINSITVTVPQAALTVTADKTSAIYGDADITLGASGGSNAGSITYSVVSGSGIIESGNKLKITGVGAITVKATRLGDDYYSPVSGTVIINVSPKALTISGVTGINRAWIGGNTNVQIGNGTLQGVVSGDDVSPDYYGGTVADANVGEDKTVTPNEIKLTGAEAANYTLTQPAYAITVDIIKASQDAPSLLTSTTATSITVTPQTGAEYSIDGTTYGSQNVFSGLNTGSAYTVYIRMAETATHAPSSPNSRTITLGFEDQDPLVITGAGDWQNKKRGDTDFQLGYTGGTINGAVTFELVGSGNAGTVSSSGLVHISDADEAGTIKVKATMEGNGTYYPAVSAEYTITVAGKILLVISNQKVSQEGSDARKFSWTGDSKATNGYAITITPVTVDDRAAVGSVINLTAAAGASSVDLSGTTLKFNRYYTFKVTALTTATHKAAFVEVQNYRWMTIMFTDGADTDWYSPPPAVNGAIRPQDSLTFSTPDGVFTIKQGGASDFRFVVCFTLSADVMYGGLKVLFDYSIAGSGSIQCCGLWNTPDYIGEWGPFDLEMNGGKAVMSSNWKDGGGNIYWDNSFGIVFKITGGNASTTVTFDNIYFKLP